LATILAEEEGWGMMTPEQRDAAMQDFSNTASETANSAARLNEVKGNTET
jgi:hypothetical protein